MADNGKEVFALIIIDMTEEQTTSGLRQRNKICCVGSGGRVNLYIKDQCFSYLLLLLLCISTDGKKWIQKRWKGYENILKLADALPGNRVFDSRLWFEQDENNSLANLYPS